MSLEALMGKTSVLTLRLWARSKRGGLEFFLPLAAKDVGPKQTKINCVQLTYLAILYTLDSFLY